MRWRPARLPDGTDDRGAVAVVVALLLVPLVGFAALSVDVGANLVERRQLQNGADAAALAVAQDTSCKAASTGTTASDLVKANVGDHLALGSATVDTTALTVTATGSAVDAAGAPGRENYFAGVLGITHTQVSARATAACGYPLAGPAFLPITFNKCEFTTPGSTILIDYNTASAKCAGQSGNAAPGNFGWLATGNSPCAVTVTATMPGQPGNSFPGGCSSSLPAIQNATILIPMYDTVSGNGNNAVFHIVGFAAFTVTGYRFSGSPALSWNNRQSTAPSCTGSCRGVIGKFVRLVSLDDSYTLGGSPSSNFGVTVAKLVS